VLVAVRIPNATLLATTPGQDYLNKKEISHTPEIKGGLKALKDKDIRIMSYEESK
jgi:hypothetical protein